MADNAQDMSPWTSLAAQGGDDSSKVALGLHALNNDLISHEGLVAEGVKSGLIHPQDAPAYVSKLKALSGQSAENPAGTAGDTEGDSDRSPATLYSEPSQVGYLMDRYESLKKLQHKPSPTPSPDDSHTEVVEAPSSNERNRTPQGESSTGAAIPSHGEIPGSAADMLNNPAVSTASESPAEDSERKGNMFSDTQKSEEKDTTNLKQNVGALPGIYQEKLAEILGGAPYQLQSSELDKLAEALKQRSNRAPSSSPLDWGGLAAFADMINKTDAYGKANKEMLERSSSDQAQSNKVGEQNYQNEVELLKARNALSSEAQKGALALVGGGTNASGTMTMEDMARMSGQKPVTSLGGKVSDDQFNKTVAPVIKDAQTKNQALSAATALLALNNPSADTIHNVVEGKTFTGGRAATETMKNLDTPDKSLWERFANALDKAGTGQHYDNKTRNELIDAYSALQSAQQATNSQNDTRFRSMNSLRANPLGPEDYQAQVGNSLNTNLPQFKKNVAHVKSITGNSPSSTGGAAHPDDNAAVQWAKSHPNDPRAAKILMVNGQ